VADVVVMNHDEDVLAGMAMTVEAMGLTVATCHATAPTTELAAFIREHEPRAVVYDLGPPPLERAVAKWRDLCREPGANRPYVITTTTPCAIEPAGCMVACVLLKPLGFDEVAHAVRRALGAT